ncbi:GTPase activating protein [Coemansia sp. RSA 1199]|nr:GTPase activating protein [Coemansia sp. RSA 1199]
MQDELSTMAQLVGIANPRLHKHLVQCDADNMFCCYWWLLIWFKREFGFEDVLQLWEVLWTDYLTDRLVLFVALAILQRHADVIIDHLRSPEEVLKYVQDLSDTIDLNDALKGAEMCFYKVRFRVHAVEQIRKSCNLPLFVSNPSDSEPTADVKEGNEDSVPADAEAPLMTFEWEDGQNSGTSEKDPLLEDDETAESDISRTPPLTSSRDSILDNDNKEKSPEDAKLDNGTLLPRISEAVHRIFAESSYNRVNYST